jgi:hypothetical protein
MYSYTLYIHALSLLAGTDLMVFTREHLSVSDLLSLPLNTPYFNYSFYLGDRLKPAYQPAGV